MLQYPSRKPIATLTLFSLFCATAMLAFVTFGKLSTANASSIIAQWTFEGDVITPAQGAGTASLVGGTSATFATGNPTGRGWNTATYPAQGVGNKSAGVRFAVSTTDYSAPI